MKIKIFILTFFLFLTKTGLSQDTAKVEKSLTSIQTSILGLHINNEYGLSNTITLKTEFGLNASVFGGFSYDKTGIILAPTLTLEPRFYYNLDKRKNKDKKYTDNNGNYLSISTTYTPDWFIISNYDNIQTVPQVTIIPSWGLKRNLSSKFMYEIGAGIGYRHINYKSIGYINNKNEFFPNLHVRIGYNF
jgi:hypothetical protein